MLPVHGTLRCQLAHADYAKTLQARCSGLDWHGFELGATRKGGVTCSGGILYSPATERPVYVNLPYGKTWRRGCSRARRGHRRDVHEPVGHGLFVSRQSWRAW